MQFYLSRGEEASILKTRAHPTLEGLIMTCTMIVGKMKGQKTGKYLVEVIVQASLLFLCAVSDDTQQTLALSKRTLVVQSTMLCEACLYYAAYYAL